MVLKLLKVCDGAALCRDAGGPGVAPVPSVGGYLGRCPSGPGELAEVVACQVEGSLDLRFDLAAEPQLMAALVDVDLTEDRFLDRLASGVAGLALLGP